MPQQWNHRYEFERIEVLHVADGDAVVVCVAHNFILDFFPAFMLRSIRTCGEAAKALLQSSMSFRLILSKSTSETT